MAGIVMRIEKRPLACVLTDAERLERAGSLTEQLSRADALKDEAKRVADDFKTRIGHAEREARILRTVVASGKEIRDIACEVIRADAIGEIHVVRGDTGELIERRAMTPEERQLTLDRVATPSTSRLPVEEEDGND